MADFEPIQEEPAEAQLVNYENFSRRLLPDLLRSYLDKELSSSLSQKLKEDLVSLVERCHAKTLASYRSQYWNDTLASTSLFKAPLAPTPATVPASRTATPAPTLVRNEPDLPTAFDTEFKGFFLDSDFSFEQQELIYSDHLLLERLSEDGLDSSSASRSKI
jgi:hypothetical protein